MSRMRTDLRPAGGSRRSPGKLPPVRNTFSPPNSARSHEWRTDMVRGLQLHATAPPSSTASTSSPKEEEKKPCLAPQQEKSRQNDNKELIEVYYCFLWVRTCVPHPHPPPPEEGVTQKNGWGWRLLLDQFCINLVKFILFMLRGTQALLADIPVSQWKLRTQISTNYVKCGKRPENFQIIP